jgi:uncharacterized protein (DUF1810 family)
MSLERFHDAQADPHAGYDTALAEIRRGRKTSDWIWYIFPQLAGLGRSAMAEKYAIRNLAEACDYLRDPLLRARYEEITTAVSDQLAARRTEASGVGGRGLALEDLMGSRIDALKLISSLTLFRAAARSLAANDTSFEPLAKLCETMLHQTAAEGYSPCSHTAMAARCDRP